MEREIRREIVLHSVRWANNMLVEVVGNHSGAIPDTAAAHLREAIRSLQEADQSLRFPVEVKPTIIKGR